MQVRPNLLVSFLVIFHRILIEKIDKSFEYLKKNGLLTDDLSKQLVKCKTVNEVHFLVSRFFQNLFRPSVNIPFFS